MYFYGPLNILKIYNLAHCKKRLDIPGLNNSKQRFSTKGPQQVFLAGTQKWYEKVLKSYICRWCFVVSERCDKIRYGMKAKAFFLF